MCSIPWALVAVGVFAVLVLLRFVCLKGHLKESSETRKKEITTEAPMKIHAVLCSIGETVADPGGNLASGLLLS